MSGAGTRDLMWRTGHGSVRAAAIYQDGGGERDRAIADRRGARVEQERPAEEPLSCISAVERATGIEPA
jgi:hypothetical protein